MTQGRGVDSDFDITLLMTLVGSVPGAEERLNRLRWRVSNPDIYQAFPLKCEVRKGQFRGKLLQFK
jgi:hypothetical protein